jgi:hypothetical protein
MRVALVLSPSPDAEYAASLLAEFEQIRLYSYFPPKRPWVSHIIFA